VQGAIREEAPKRRRIPFGSSERKADGNLSPDVRALLEYLFANRCHPTLSSLTKRRNHD
jgi:hypothetical protein